MEENIDNEVEDVEEQNLFDGSEDLTTQKHIQNRYCFWYHRRGGRSQSATINYEESMKLLASFQTVEHFWHIYNHLIRPNDIRSTTDYHLFKDGIKPTWEDPQNKNGGKWMVRLRKGLASLLWEEIILAIIGEQFDVGHEICGAVISVRNGEDIISVWNKTADNVEATNKIREHMRKIMKLPNYVQIEYKKHMDSLADKSSFRNPTLVWKPRENTNTRTGQGYHNKDGQSHGYHNKGDGQGAGTSTHHRGDRGDHAGNRDEDQQPQQRKEHHNREGGWKQQQVSNVSGNNDSATGGTNTRNNTWSNRDSTAGSGGHDAWAARNKKREDTTGHHPIGGSGGSGNEWSRPKDRNNTSTGTATNLPTGARGEKLGPSAADSANVWSRRGASGTAAGGGAASSSTHSGSDQ